MSSGGGSGRVGVSSVGLNNEVAAGHGDQMHLELLVSHVDLRRVTDSRDPDGAVSELGACATHDEHASPLESGSVGRCSGSGLNADSKSHPTMATVEIGRDGHAHTHTHDHSHVHSHGSHRGKASLASGRRAGVSTGGLNNEVAKGHGRALPPSSPLACPSQSWLPTLRLTFCVRCVVKSFGRMQTDLKFALVVSVKQYLASSKLTWTGRA